MFRNHLRLLVGVLATGCMAVAAVVFTVLWDVSLRAQEQRLAEFITVQAKMTQAIIELERAEHPNQPIWRDEALSEVVTALASFPGFGETGEFTFGRREGGQIIFLLRHRHGDFDHPLPVAWDCDLAEPMRRALRGETGTVIGKDYRGVQVLAAHIPIPAFNAGLVAKMDMDEVRAPFARAALGAIAVTALVILLAALAFRKIIHPLLHRLMISERRHRALFENMTDAGAVLVPVDDGADFVFRDINPAARDGMEPDEVIGRRLGAVYPGAGNAPILAALRRVHQVGVPESLPMSFYEDERISGWREHNFYRLPTGELVHIWNDVTLKKRAEASLQMASSVFEHAGEGIVVTSPGGIIERVNPAFTSITGYSAEEALGKTPALLKSDRQPPEFYQEMWQGLRRSGTWQGEIWNRRKNGEAYLEWLTISSIRDESDRISHYVAVFDDISELHEKEQHIRHQAFHDVLTGLANRSLFMDRLDQAISSAARLGGRIAVLFIDLDRFKNVNDSLGHDVGDDLLRLAAARLKTVLRGSDTVARLGGDEFAVLSPGLEHITDATVLAEKLLAAFTTPFAVAGRDLHIGASIGIALHPVDGATAHELLRSADTAMYAVKEAGRASYRFFDSSMNDEAVERLTLENDLRQAVERGELDVVYQPKFILADGRLAGAEALIRWTSAVHGIVPPSRFIPLAEETGLIVVIGEWVLRTVCRQVAAWKAAGFRPGPIAVNVSARQVVESDFAVLVAAILDDEGVAVDEIDLEITETAIMRDPARAAAMLSGLSSYGIRIVLDDFGVGYSSLGYLKRLPIAVLKMDASFIHDVTDDENAARLARGIIDLADQLGIEVVAEGVETEAQADFLRAHGCALVQGFLFARPMPADAMRERFQADARGEPSAAIEAAAKGADAPARRGSNGVEAQP